MENDIRKTIEELSKNDPTFLDNFVRELTEEDIDKLKMVLGNFPLANMGEKLYRLPGGAICGADGLELFHKEMIKQFKNAR